MSEAHQALVRRFWEHLWHQGNLDAIEACIVPNAVRHVSHTGMRSGRDLEKEGMLCTHR